MKKFIYMAVAAIAALSGCSNDNEITTNETGMQPLVFTASMEGVEGATTRATFDGTNKCASWEEDDQIIIKANTRDAFYPYKAEAEGLTTTFIPDEQGLDPAADYYEAYFGCETSGNYPCIPENVVETWEEGKFNMPMYATSATKKLQFYNLCGVLKLKVKAPHHRVKSITLRNESEPLAGRFDVDGKEAHLHHEGSKTRKVTYSELAPISGCDDGIIFYVAVPAQDYSPGLKITLTDIQGETKDMTTNRDITVKRNMIYPITFNWED